MMNDARRYLRAFWGALRMTIRGEKIAGSTPTPLSIWINDYRTLVTAVFQAAEHEGVDRAARERIILRLDGRPMNLETALLTLKFHASEEYPSLARQGTGRGVLNTLYATNMNDRYWVSQMSANPELQATGIQKAFAALDSHLDNIPRL